MHKDWNYQLRNFHVPCISLTFYNPTAPQFTKMDNNICAICLDSLFDENEPTHCENHSICSQAPCGHIFHTHCILNWLNRSFCSFLFSSQANGLCPLCRENVYEGDLIPVRVPPTPPVQAHRQRVYIRRQEQVSDSEEVEEEEGEEEEESTISPSNQHLENEDANLDSNSKYSWLLNQFQKSRLWPLVLKLSRKCFEWIFLAFTDDYIFPLILLSYAVIGSWWYGWSAEDKNGIAWKGWWKFTTDNNGWGLERNSGWTYQCNRILNKMLNCQWNRGLKFQCTWNQNGGWRWKCDWLSH